MGQSSQHKGAGTGEEGRTTIVQHANEQWEVFQENPPLVCRHVANISERLQAAIDNNGGWGGC